MSEIDSLKDQVRQLEEMINQETDDNVRKEYEQAKADLEELIGLMQEEEEEGEDGKGQGTSSEELKEGDEDVDIEALLGSRCVAPFDADRSLPLHTAIIMEIESSSKVRVLFSHPTCPAMKPCTHYLNSNCRFNENCRFSHGYLVDLTRIDDYEEPDFSSISEQSLVLVKGSSDLWEMGRISAIDGQDVAVKLLKSGMEVSSKRKDLVPIGEVPEDSKKDDSWKDLKQETLGNVSVGEMGNWNGGDVGMKLMLKMGYKLGEGLGKRSDGIVHAIQAKICTKNASLDELMTRKRKVVDGKMPASRKKFKSSNDSERDIFAFINKRFDKKSERTLEDVRREKEEMSGYSSKTLGAKNLDLSLELKQLQAKHKKLKDGILRNHSDKNTVAKMKTSLQEIEEKIASVHRKQNRVQSEVNSRNSKRNDDF